MFKILTFETVRKVSLIFVVLIGLLFFIAPSLTDVVFNQIPFAFAGGGGGDAGGGGGGGGSPYDGCGGSDCGGSGGSGGGSGSAGVTSNTCSAGAGSVTISWSYSGACSHANRSLNEGSPTQTTCSGSYTYNGLASQTSYTYRLTWFLGTLLETQLSSFTTQNCTPTPSPSGAPTVTTQPATEVTHQSARIHGTVNPNGASTNAWFWHSTGNPGNCNAAFGSPTTQQAMGSGSSGLSYNHNFSNGLIPNTTYYYCAVAENTGGQGRGSLLSFTTSPQSLPDYQVGINPISGITAGDDVTFSMIITNIGDNTSDSAGPSMNTDFYLDEGDNGGTACSGYMNVANNNCDLSFSGQVFKGASVPHGGPSITRDSTSTWTAVAGPHQLFACADTASEEIEINDSFNSNCAWLTFNVSAAPQPDLVQAPAPLCDNDGDDDGDELEDEDDPGCHSGSNGEYNPNDDDETDEPANVMIDANPLLVAAGGGTTLTWDARNVTACEVTGTHEESLGTNPVDSWSMPPPPAEPEFAWDGTANITDINEERTYTISCQPAGADSTDVATIKILPSFEEF